MTDMNDIDAARAALTTALAAIGDGTPKPTVKLFRPIVEAAATPSMQSAYNAGWNRLEAAHGDTRIDRITHTDLDTLTKNIKVSVGEAKVAAAAKRNRPLLSADPHAHGHGAAENFVRGTRMFFRIAADVHKIANPAVDLEAPRRPPAPERALTDEELFDVVYACTEVSDDPDLDQRLYDFIRHTACRRESTLYLRLCDLDERSMTVMLSEKFGQVRRMPLARWQIRSLESFARSRGATGPNDNVFRYRNGNPMTRKRFEQIFDKLDAFSTWSEPLDVGAHWLRHTTITDVEKVASFAVAQKFAGHSNSQLVTLRYSTVTFDDLVAAYERLFGDRAADCDPEA